MRSGLVSSARRVAWAQWGALGVASTTDESSQAVDLEALICFTPMLREEEPRLVDEALDWCVSHSARIVSVTRLRHIRAKLDGRARHAYDRFAASVNATAKPKTPWPTEQIAEKVRTSSKSKAPQLDHRALLQLRLRALVGVTVRAETLMQFLRPSMTMEPAPTLNLTAGALVDVGYSRPAIGDVLADLASAGVLERWRRGNQDHYTLARKEALVALVGGPLPTAAPNWVAIFRVLTGLMLAEIDTRDKKPIVRAVAIDTVFRSYAHELERLAVKTPPQPHDWTSIGDWFEAAVSR